MPNASPLTGIGASHIFRTFVVTEEEAALVASSYIGLIESNGGQPSNFTPSGFEALLTKQLSGRYQWRDSDEKERWEREQRSVADGYNQWIAAGLSDPFKKWPSWRVDLASLLNKAWSASAWMNCQLPWPPGAAAQPELGSRP